MTDYIYLQTYTQCDEDAFYNMLELYRGVLERLKCSNEEMLDWLTDLHWPTSEEDMFGDIFAAPFTLSPQSGESIECEGMDVSLYTIMPVQSIEDMPPWAGMNLLFDAATLRQETSSAYKPEIRRAIWDIMRELATTFHEVGVYFTDEWQENRAWRAIVEDSGEPWSFDLGIFPKALAQHFSNVPAGYKGTVIPQGFAFAQTNRWPILPWQETEDNARIL